MYPLVSKLTEEIITQLQSNHQTVECYVKSSRVQSNITCKIQGEHYDIQLGPQCIELSSVRSVIPI